MFVNTNIMAQICGIGSLVVTVLSTWGHKKNMIFMLLIDSLSLSLAYFLLGEITGALTSVLCLLRSATALYLDKYPNALSKTRHYIPFIFATVFLAIGIITFDKASCIIIISAGLLSCLAAFSKNDSTVRISVALVIVLYLIYDLLVGSYMSMLGELISTISGIISIAKNEVLPWIKRSKCS